MGREATGHVIEQERRPATTEDAGRLQLPERTPVLHVLRVRGLDGEPVLLERTVYADWISPPSRPSSRLPLGRPAALEDTGLVFAYGEHVIDAVAAGAQDADLLGVRARPPPAGTPRHHRPAKAAPVEWSDDRYRWTR